MFDGFDALSSRARAYLASVGCRRSAPVASREAIAAMFDPPLDAELLRQVVGLEERYGGVIVDAAKLNLELGLGALAARHIPPETHSDPDLVLIGTEAEADILIDRRGWVWASAADDVGEQAVGIDKYIEHIAALATPPWPDAHFTLFCDPRAEDVIRVLDLGVDDDASDDVVTLASSDQHQLVAQRRGTDWLTSRIKLRCRSFAALRRALSALHAELPDLRGAIASGHASWIASRVPRQDALRPLELEVEILPRSAVRLDGLSGGAIHLLRDGGIEAYALTDRGLLANHHELTSSGGRYREFFGPPSSHEDPSHS